MQRRPDEPRRDEPQIDDDRGHVEDEAEARRRAERAYRARMSKIALGLILLILFVIFNVQNAGARTLRFLFWEFQVPLILALAASAILGAAITLLLGWPYRRRFKRYIRELERERDERGPR